MRKRIIAILLLSLVTSNVAMAKKKVRVYPRGCSPENTQFEYDYLLLGATPKPEADPYSVFVFRNMTHQNILVGQAPEQNDMGAHFNSVIEPNRFSAMLIERPGFKLVCYDTMGSEPWPVPCNQVLKACQLRVSPIMVSARGQYWIAQNARSQRSLFGELRGHGIYP